MTSLLDRLPNLVIVIALACAGIAAPVVAQTGVPRDIAIVLDNSGSMRKADPKFAMRDAVTRFAATLGADDRVALLLFDHRVRVLKGFAAAGVTSTDALREHLKQLDYRGRLTDSPRAIERAIYEMKTNARPGAERIVVFLTDGIVDTGNPALDVERAQWLREDLARDARESGLRIYSIAFTREADAFLVQSLAQQTGAAYTRAESADDLPAAFDELSSRMQPAAVAVMDEPMPVAEPSAPEATAPGAVVEEADPAGGEAAPAPATGGPATRIADAPPVSTGANATASEAPVVATEADGPPPAMGPALAELTERLGITTAEAEQLVASTELPAADVLALVDEAGLTLDQLRAMGAGETVVERPGEDVRVEATPAPVSAELAKLTERLGISTEEARHLVDSTQLPPEDLLALLDEAGLTLEELQGLAVGGTVVSRPGEATTSLRTPQVAADLGRTPAVPQSAQGATGATATTPVAQEPPTGTAPAALPETAPVGPAGAPAAPAPAVVATAPATVAADQTSAAPGDEGTPLWIVLTTIGGIIALALGALMALRPRGRQALELSAAAADASPAGGGPLPAGVPDAWLSDLRRHSGRERIPLTAKLLAVGRVAGTDPERLEYLVVNQPTIGRRHALIEFRDFAWFITDQGSVNGTFVNGQRIGSSGQRLRNGDRIRFHRYEFEFVQPEEVPDHEATMVAQIPGEATLVADRTLVAASTVALAASASGVVAAATMPQVPAAAAGRGSEPGAAPPAGALDTHGGLGSTSEPTRFNPAPGPIEDEAGLDMFMASQVFGATSTPPDAESPADDRASSDGATVVLPGPIVSLDLSLDGDPEASGPVAAFTAGTAAGLPVDGARATGRFTDAPPGGAPRGGSQPASTPEGAFDDDFFGTHQLAAVPPGGSSGGARPARGPAEVFFPENPASGTGEMRPAAPTSAPDQPPVDLQDDFFGEAAADVAGTGGPRPVASGDDDPAFFATTVGGPPASGKPLPASSPAAGAPPASAGDDGADGFFATVIQPGAAAAAAWVAAPIGGQAPPGSMAPSEPQRDETLRVRADSTVIMGGPFDDGPLLAGAPAAGTTAASSGQPLQPRRPAGEQDGKDGDFAAFFDDDSSR